VTLALLLLALTGAVFATAGLYLHFLTPRQGCPGCGADPTEGRSLEDGGALLVLCRCGTHARWMGDRWQTARRRERGTHAAVLRVRR
jgi:hypothetical protein